MNQPLLKENNQGTQITHQFNELSNPEEIQNKNKTNQSKSLSNNHTNHSESSDMRAIMIQKYEEEEDQQEDEQEESYIYNVPDVAHITKRVLFKLIAASIIAFLFLLAEIVGGLLAKSLAILSDAAHMFSDLSGFFISIFSIWIGSKPASQKLSFGYHRAEVIGALASIFIIWGITLLLVYEATHRIINMEKVQNPLFMIITAGFGLVCNLIIAKVLHTSPHHHKHEVIHHSHDKNKIKVAKEKNGINSYGSICMKSQDNIGSCSHKSVEGKQDFQERQTIENKEGQQALDLEHQEIQTGENQENKVLAIGIRSESQKQENTSLPIKNLSKIQVKENYNLRAAMMHVIGDIFQSIGVFIASVIIYFLGEKSIYWHLADPLCTYLFSILVTITTISVSKECIRVLMEGTPKEINEQEFEDKLKNLNGVLEIHDLHIWSLSKGKPSLSCHIFTNQKSQKQVLKEVTKLCRNYGIYHSTIQVEEIKEKGRKNYIKCQHNIHN